MLIQLSAAAQREIETSIRAKLDGSLTVNPYETASVIRTKYAIIDVSLDDIAASIARQAVQFGCIVEFGKARAERAESCA